MTKPGYDERARAAVERLDVLEDSVPSGACAARGCNRTPRYEWAGAFGDTHMLCAKHRSVYRTHDRILARIRAL